MEAKERLERVIKHAEEAMKLLDSGEKRLGVGQIDNIEASAEAAKWMVINEIIEEEGGL